MQGAVGLPQPLDGARGLSNAAEPSSSSPGFSGRVLGGAPAQPHARRSRRTPLATAVAERPAPSMDGLDAQALRSGSASHIARWRQEVRQGQGGGLPSGFVTETPDNWHVSDGWRALPHHLGRNALWSAMVAEARSDAAMEPALASFLHTTVIMQRSLDKGLAFLLANKLSSPTLLGMQLTRLFLDAYADDPSIVESAVADIHAVRDRDPACESYAQCLLYFKGFHAIQCHRVAHWMWRRGRKTLAIALASRMSEVFHVDIHPAAYLGRGILLDHATGVVIGETARVGDNVVLLHRVTLGGSGVGSGVRHPNIGNGVLLGAGVCVLGPVSLGRGSKVGAGSVVVDSLPSHSVAVGIPARVIRRESRAEPVMDMDMVSDFVVDYVI